MIRVVVFDDNPKQRNALRLLVDSTEGMQCVEVFDDCREAAQRIEVTRPDVVLMDIDMPNVNGIEGVALIRSRFPKLRIIMQTVFDDEDKIFDALCAGADGYLLKNAAPDELINGIMDVLKGGAPMSPSVARKVLLLAGGKERKNTDLGLTGRELEILALLVQGHSYKMIADRCGISAGTVNTHVRSIYDKLQVHSAAGAVSMALRRGLV
ncbi:MAG TPA: response regulator transcription factor [Flavobacteriales bacterium]|nr:response regulator transcription factor [Flavobacteriales bacterium]